MALITQFRKGFPEGYSAVTREGEPELDVGMDFGIYVLSEGKTIEERHSKESVWVLMGGKARIEFAEKKEIVERKSLFDEAPTTLHVGPDTQVKIAALSPRVEWAVSRVENQKSFSPRLFRPRESVPEYRGKGLAQDACLRNVRLIFDGKTRKDSNLVIGEVINYPGRWSSYPPHHHTQPEIYHYRFTLPQGYGHAELGDHVYKVCHYDTLKILNGLDHAQVSAPGYGMYYLWVIRHLRDNPYTGFEFTPDHTWVLDSEKQGWRPAE